MTDTQEQTLPVAVEPSADAPAANGAAGRPAKMGGSLSSLL